LVPAKNRSAFLTLARLEAVWTTLVIAMGLHEDAALFACALVNTLAYDNGTDRTQAAA
jgi:hypothetical protein